MIYLFLCKLLTAQHEALLLITYFVHVIRGSGAPSSCWCYLNSVFLCTCLKLPVCRTRENPPSDMYAQRRLKSVIWSDGDASYLPCKCCLLILVIYFSACCWRLRSVEQLLKTSYSSYIIEADGLSISYWWQLFVCFIRVYVTFNHLSVISRSCLWCDREFSAHFWSAASPKYNAHTHDMIFHIFSIYKGCVQKCKVTANVLSWVIVLNDERQQEQRSRAKQSRVTCTSEHSPGLRSVNRDDRGYCYQKQTFRLVVTVFNGWRQLSANYSQAVLWHNRNGGLCE